MQTPPSTPWYKENIVLKDGITQFIFEELLNLVPGCFQGLGGRFSESQVLSPYTLCYFRQRTQNTQKSDTSFAIAQQNHNCHKMKLFSNLNFYLEI